MKVPYEDYIINGQVVKNSHSYLKHEREVVHTSIRKDIYKELSTLSKRRKKPMSKILDCIWTTFEEHPEIKREFFKRLKEY